MVQIKLSIAIVLAAAAIAPVVSLPVTLKNLNGAELNARDDSEMFERSFEHFDARAEGSNCGSKKSLMDNVENAWHKLWHPLTPHYYYRAGANGQAQKVFCKHS